MNLKTLINYYKNCPICNGDMIVNTDTSARSIIEIEDDGLSLSVYETDGKSPKVFKLLYSNKIESEHSLIINTPDNMLLRTMRMVPTSDYDAIQLEMACIDCGKFRYWSNYISFNHETKEIGPISIRWEEAKLTDKNERMTLFNDLKNQELTVYAPDHTNTCKIPFIGNLSGLPLKETSNLILHIKKQLIIS